MTTPIKVAVAVIENARGEVLLAQRHAHAHQGGLWEFPGGKIEAGESVQFALARELDEELGIIPHHLSPLIRLHHDYHDKQVMLDVWRVRAFSGEAHGKEGQPLVWVAKQHLNQWAVPAANRRIVTAVQLPEHYLVTPEPQDPDVFVMQLSASLKQHAWALVQLRAPALAMADYVALATRCLAVCRQYGAKLLLNATPDCLMQVDADGLHLNSVRLLQQTTRPIAADKCLSVACHDLVELERAAMIDADCALLSPVLATATHSDASLLGWAEFAALVAQVNFPVYALGGVWPRAARLAQGYGAQGVAGVRAFWVDGVS